MKSYNKEVKERWGNTQAFCEYCDKTKNYTKEKWDETGDGIMAIFFKLSACKEGGYEASSEEAQSLVKALQEYISEAFYTCTKETLSGLGKMYTHDERFKNNIDRCGNGTAEYTARAIEEYCRK